MSDCWELADKVQREEDQKEQEFLDKKDGLIKQFLERAKKIMPEQQFDLFEKSVSDWMCRQLASTVDKALDIIEILVKNKDDREKAFSEAERFLLHQNFCYIEDISIACLVAQFSPVFGDEFYERIKQVSAWKLDYRYD